MVQRLSRKGTMTELRKRFLEDMQLRGLAPSTQTVYVHVIRQIAKHYHQSPDLLSEDQIRQYFLHLTQVRHVSRSLATTTLCALKFFFERTLQRRWPLFALARPRKVKSLPTVLSRDEVRRLLACVEGPTFHMYFTTVYACGLRREEARLLRVQDIDGARGLVHVRGKGAKERWVPLPSPLLIQLREFWKTHRTRPWLFPHPGSLDRPRPLSRRALHMAFAAARERCGLNKHPVIHSLRHCYGTHLLESGVNLRVIQSNLGHRSANTTALYTHLTEPALAAVGVLRKNGQ